jgi:hypothetical protein
VCNKHKKSKLRDLDEAPILEKKRNVVGTDCKVCITIGDCDVSGKWIVCTVNLVHNHDLTLASSFLIPTYRYISFRYQKILQYNEDQGMLPKDNIDIVIRSAGGYGKCTFTRRDVRNHLDKYKRQKLRAVGGDDAVLLADYFQKKIFI